MVRIRTSEKLGGRRTSFSLNIPPTPTTPTSNNGGGNFWSPKAMRKSRFRKVADSASTPKGLRGFRLNLASRFRGSSAHSIVPRGTTVNPKKSSVDKQSIYAEEVMEDDFLDGAVDGGAFLTKTQTSLRVRLRKKLASSTIGVVFDVISSSFSIVACLFFVLEAYEDSLEELFGNFELLIGSFFTFEFLLRLYVADNRLNFLFEASSLVDIITIMPMIVDIFILSGLAGGTSTGNELLKFIKFIRVLRIVRILRLHRMFLYYDNEVTRETAKFCLNIFSISFIAAGAVFSIENFGRESLYIERLELHDAVYFIIATISTVGFGDIKVYTGLGQLFITGVILFSLIFIPYSTNSLLKIISEKSVYTMKKYRPMSHVRHVLIIGDITADGAREFLREFFHPDHGSSIDVHVVLLMEQFPSQELKGVIESQRYELVVSYLQGSVYCESDLERARAFEASACFVMANKYSLDSERTDLDNLLKALAVKQYYKKLTGKDVKVCIQLIRPENEARYLRSFAPIKPLAPVTKPKPLTAPSKRHLSFKGVTTAFRRASTATVASSSGKYNSANSRSGREKVLENSVEDQDVVVCINQIKMHLLAKSCLCPGTITLISNLIISSDDSRGSGDESSWQEEYNKGCDFELYRTRLNSSFSNLAFEDIALSIYLETGTLLIGLEVHLTVVDDDGREVNDVRLFFNPVGFVLPQLSSRVSIFAIVVAEDKSRADLNGARSWLAVGETPNSEVQNGFGSSFYPKVRKIKEGSSNNIQALVAKHKPTACNLSSIPRKSDVNRFGRNARPSMIHRESSVHVRREISAATVRTRLEEEFPKVRNHIVYTGSLTNFKSFLDVIRNQEMGGSSELIPVVVLAMEPPSSAIWNSFADDAIYFVEGSALDVYDLKRAGIEYARCAVVCSWDAELTRDEDEENGGFDNETSTAADADSIFAHQGIKRLNPSIEIFTEVFSTSNIVFLETKTQIIPKLERSLSKQSLLSDQGIGENGVGADTTKSFAEENDRHTTALIASGCVFTSSLLDALICQSFFNPQMLNIIQHFIAGSCYASQKYHSQWTTSLPNLSESSHLYVIPVPKAYHGKTYGELFSFMVQQHRALCIGLSRGVNARRIGLGKAGNRHRYIVNNPPKYSVIEPCDQVFILSQTEPSAVLFGKDIGDLVGFIKSKNQVNLTKAWKK